MLYSYSRNGQCCQSKIQRLLSTGVSGLPQSFTGSLKRKFKHSSVFVSISYWNKSPQIWLLKTTQIYSPTILEIVSLKSALTLLTSRGWQACFLLEAEGRISLLAFFNSLAPSSHHADLLLPSSHLLLFSNQVTLSLPHILSGPPR